jgi:hypothetical protein
VNSHAWNLLRIAAVFVVCAASVASGALLTRMGSASGIQSALAGILIVLPGAALTAFTLGLRADTAPTSRPPTGPPRKEDAS